MSFNRRLIWSQPMPLLSQEPPAPREHMFAVCAYGDSPYLEACIKSLRAQTVPTGVILCTSTPSPYIEALAQKYGVSVYVREGESDICQDWNYAYHMAAAKLVTIAHQDDMYQKDYVKTLLEYYGRYPDMTVFTGDYIVVKDGKLQSHQRSELVKRVLRLPLRRRAWSHRTTVKKMVLMFGNPICCPACTYNKAALGEPLFDSPYKFALDWDTLFSLAERPGRFVCVERPLMYYRIHGEATTKRCIDNKRREHEEEAMFRKFWPKPAAHFLMHFYRKAYEAYD